MYVAQLMRDVCVSFACVFVQILKLYAWEPSFTKQISDVRDQELRYLWLSSLWSAGMTFTWTVAPYMVSISLFQLLVSYTFFSFSGFVLFWVFGWVFFSTKEDRFQFLLENVSLNNPIELK